MNNTVFPADLQHWFARFSAFFFHRKKKKNRKNSGDKQTRRRTCLLDQVPVDYGVSFQPPSDIPFARRLLDGIVGVFVAKHRDGRSMASLSFFSLSISSRKTSSF